MEARKKNEDMGKLVDKEKISNISRKTNLSSYIRADIAFPVSVISQHVYFPKEVYLEVYKILRYLKVFLSIRLFFKNIKLKM